MVVALTVVLLGTACGGNDPDQEATRASAPVAEDASTLLAFTEADLDQLERGLRREIEAIKAAQARAASAPTAEERGEAIQAQWETATIPLGAEASGLSDRRYRDVREGVNRVFTTLDFQGKIDGPLSIDLERADSATKSRLSGDAFADLPPEAATALRARMDRLIPLWSEYKTLVAVAG
jgi:hypothetical protein